jgi:hypothetical protein
MMRIPSVFALQVLLVAAGCGSLGHGTREESGVVVQDGGFVLAGQSLLEGPGDLLSTMTGRIPSMRMRRMSEQCPQITLRGAASYQSVVNPHVYVDGARATDTCVLEMLDARDVERVEVYPTGVSPRPGYGTHAHGLILVFMRTAHASAADTLPPPLR